MTNYTRGRSFEYKVRNYFKDLGWVVVRSAGSKTKADLVAMKSGITLLVQCKRTGWPGPKERLAFADTCHLAGCSGIVAQATRGKFHFRGITPKGELGRGWTSPDEPMPHSLSVQPAMRHHGILTA